MRHGCCELSVPADQPDHRTLPAIETDVFALTVSDGTNTSAPANITIEIVDDVSNAVNDTNSVAEDTVAPITGNVLTNDLHPNGQPGADTPRAS